MTVWRAVGVADLTSVSPPDIVARGLIEPGDVHDLFEMYVASHDFTLTLARKMSYKTYFPPLYLVLRRFVTGFPLFWIVILYFGFGWHGISPIDA